MKKLIIFASTAVRHNNGHCTVNRKTNVHLFRAPNGYVDPVFAKMILGRAFPDDSRWFGINQSIFVIPDSVIERYIAMRQAGASGNVYPLLSLWGFAVFLPKQNQLHTGTVTAMTKDEAREALAKLIAQQRSPATSYSIAIAKIPAKLLREEEPPASASDQSIREQFAEYLSAGKS